MHLQGFLVCIWKMVVYIVTRCKRMCFCLPVPMWELLGFEISFVTEAYFSLLKQRLRLKNSEDGLSFGNEVYQIKFPEDRPATPLLFGDRYNFYLQDVVDCPEFLIHPPTLET